MFKSFYAREVLGIKSYICPPSVHKLRQIEGPWGAFVLAVSLETLLPSQKELLKKIMASIGFFEYSLLQIKEKKLLEKLSSVLPAEFVLVFGSKNRSYKSALFQTPYGLKELEGSSLEVREKKQKLWQDLKQWKQINKL